MWFPEPTMQDGEFGHHFVLHATASDIVCDPSCSPWWMLPGHQLSCVVLVPFG